MGQMTVGIMWGASLPKGVNAYDDEADDGGLFERYTKHAVGEYTERGDWWKRRNANVPSQSEERNVAGFWIALDGGGDEYGVSEVKDAPLGKTAATYRAALRRAKTRWSRFAKWARTQGVKLPRARLWLATTEVA